MLGKDDPNSVAKVLNNIQDDGNGQGSGRRRVDYFLDQTGGLHEAITNQSASARMFTAYTFDGTKGWLTNVRTGWQVFAGD